MNKLFLLIGAIGFVNGCGDNVPSGDYCKTEVVGYGEPTTTCYYSMTIPTTTFPATPTPTPKPVCFYTKEGKVYACDIGTISTP